MYENYEIIILSKKSKLFKITEKRLWVTLNRIYELNLRQKAFWQSQGLYSFRSEKKPSYIFYIWNCLIFFFFSKTKTQFWGEKKSIPFLVAKLLFCSKKLQKNFHAKFVFSFYNVVQNEFLTQETQKLQKKLFYFDKDVYYSLFSDKTRLLG